MCTCVHVKAHVSDNYHGDGRRGHFSLRPRAGTVAKSRLRHFMLHWSSDLFKKMPSLKRAALVCVCAPLLGCYALRRQNLSVPILITNSGQSPERTVRRTRRRSSNYDIKKNPSSVKAKRSKDSKRLNGFSPLEELPENETPPDVPSTVRTGPDHGPCKQTATPNAVHVIEDDYSLDRPWWGWNQILNALWALFHFFSFLFLVVGNIFSMMMMQTLKSVIGNKTNYWVQAMKKANFWVPGSKNIQS